MRDRRRDRRRDTGCLQRVVTPRACEHVPALVAVHGHNRATVRTRKCQPHEITPKEKSLVVSNGPPILNCPGA